MYCKLDDADMTPTSFSMNTILTNEKQKLADTQIESEKLHNEEDTRQSGVKKEELKKIEDDKPKKEELSSEAKHVHVNLEESELWKKFKSLTNEMIVTKNGRYNFFSVYILYLFFFYISLIYIRVEQSKKVRRDEVVRK